MIGISDKEENMAAKLTDRSSIPAVVAELTLEEKAHLLTGASSFTTYAVAL